MAEKRKSTEDDLNKRRMGSPEGRDDKIRGGRPEKIMAEKRKSIQDDLNKRKSKRKISSLEKVYGQVADRSSERLRKKVNITDNEFFDELEGKMKKDITEAGKAMGGYKDGGRAKLKGGGMSQRGLGRAFKKGGRA